MGATRNFGILLENTDADYIFFCDQDDVWINDKIERELQKIQEIECGEISVPCLVFSDMKIMNEAGLITNNSLWQNLNLHPSFFTLNRLLIQNIPHGCTIVINKAMRNLACPVPKEAILHDQWIALLAVICGRWDFIAEPTVLLRNHEGNVTRKHTSVTDKMKRFLNNLFSKKEYDHFIKIRVDQASALQLRTSVQLNKEQGVILNNFILLEKTKGFTRKRIFIQNKFFRTTFIHTFKMILRA